MRGLETCSRCYGALETGRVDLYRDDCLVETICHACDANDHLQEYQKTRRLSMTLIMNATIGRRYSAEDNIRILAENDVVNEAVKKFEKEVWWDGGLQVWNKQSRERGFSDTQGNIEVRMYTLAGRTMITMLDKARGIDMTVITSEDDERKYRRRHGSGELYMGLQSISATAREAVELIADVRKLHAQGQLNFQPNSHVSII